MNIMEEARNWNVVGMEVCTYDEIQKFSSMDLWRDWEVNAVQFLKNTVASSLDLTKK